MKRSDKALLKKALYDSEIIRIKRLEMLPRVTGEHSEKYKKRLEEIFNSFDDIEEKNKRRSKRKTFLIAAIIALLALSFSACAVIEPVRNFFIEFYENYIKFVGDSEDAIDLIEEKYSLSYIPLEYELKNKTLDQTSYSLTYKNGEKTIIYNQVTLSTVVTYDEEHHVVSIGDLEVYVFTKMKNDIVSWSNGEYLFDISYPEDLDFSEVEKMILSVAPISE